MFHNYKEIVERFPAHKILYFDWRSGQVNVIRESDERETLYQSLDDLLDSLDEQVALIGESTFESYDLQARRRIIKRALDEGHTFRTTPNRQTGRTRRQLGLEKSDTADAITIREIARNGAHLKEPRVPDQDWITLREEANKKLMRLRSTKVRVPKKNGTGYKKTLGSEQDLYAEQLIEQLPDYSTLDRTKQLALGNLKEYAKVTVATVAVTAEAVSSNREFDNLTGLFHHGYPSLIRSNLLLHEWANKFRRLSESDVAKKNKDRAKKGQKAKSYEESQPTLVDQLSLSEFRREIRWLYRQLKDLV